MTAPFTPGVHVFSLDVPLYFYISFTGGVDYTPGPYSVTFPSGMTIASFDISITDDNIFEGSEDVKIEIIGSLPNGIAVGDPDHATVTIVDDDSKMASLTAHRITYAYNYIYMYIPCLDNF